MKRFYECLVDCLACCLLFVALFVSWKLSVCALSVAVTPIFETRSRLRLLRARRPDLSEFANLVSF